MGHKRLPADPEREKLFSFSLPFKRNVLPMTLSIINYSICPLPDPFSLWKEIVIRDDTLNSITFVTLPSFGKAPEYADVEYDKNRQILI